MLDYNINPSNKPQLRYLFFFTEYLEYFSPDFNLHPDVSTKQENLNTKQVIFKKEKKKSRVNERVSNSCLIANEQFSCYIMARTSCFNEMIMSALY